MEVINGEWIIKGMRKNDPNRIKTHEQLVSFVNKIGFLPLFSNEIEGFSVEENVLPSSWWTGNKHSDPWEWREIIASEREVAYGKFFDGRAGFISLEWLPVFANYRRNGYDFDSRWDNGLANRREKLIMDMLTEKDADGETIWTDKQILTTDLKKLCGFGKNGEKNFPGIITGLMMQTYLVIIDFNKRVSKKGAEYGMPVSVMLPPEAIWGYEHITSEYADDPRKSRKRIVDRIIELFPDADMESIVKVIGKEPKDN